MKKIKILTIILLIILISMVGFLGVYGQVQNRMENQVKDYSKLMNLKGSRTIRLRVNKENKDIIKDAEGKVVESEETLTDEQIAEKGYTKESVPYNSEDVLNSDNYKKTKDRIQTRLESLGIIEYEISVDEQSGDILIQLPENTNTDEIVSNIATVGKFEIIDSETQEVLMNNDDIKTAKVMYSQDSSTGTSGTSVYLQIEFNKEGTKKLEDISTTYIKTNTAAQNTTTAEGEAAESAQTTEKKVSLKIDDTELISTSFDEPMKTGKMQLTVGKATTDTKTLNDSVKRASNIATVLDTGNLPIKYSISENQYILSEITDQQVQYIGIGALVVIAIGILVLIFRYKAMGILAGIAYIGLTALHLLIIRYTNVAISLEGVFGIGVILVLNYIFINKLLATIQKANSIPSKDEIKVAEKETFKDFFIKMVPICIATIVFCFVQWSTISSFGMVMFWGIALIAAYNYIVTDNLLKIKADK